MEDQVDATVFLDGVEVRKDSESLAGETSLRREEVGLTCAARAMHREASRPVSEAFVVIMPNLLAVMKAERSLIFSSVEGSSRFFALYLFTCSASWWVTSAVHS